MRTYYIFKFLCSNNESILLRVYNPCVRLLVEPTVTVFSPVRKKEIYCVERVQNSFTRKLLACTGAFSCHRIPSAVERNRLLGLPSLAARRQPLDVCTAHNLLHHGCPIRHEHEAVILIDWQTRALGVVGKNSHSPDQNPYYTYEISLHM